VGRTAVRAVRELREERCLPDSVRVTGGVAAEMAWFTTAEQASGEFARNEGPGEPIIFTSSWAPAPPRGQPVLDGMSRKWLDPRISSLCALQSPLQQQKKNPNQSVSDKPHFSRFFRTFFLERRWSFACPFSARARRRSRAVDQYRSYFAIHGLSAAANASDSK
jgi:hypothetical protein